MGITRELDEKLLMYSYIIYTSTHGLCYANDK